MDAVTSIEDVPFIVYREGNRELAGYVLLVFLIPLVAGLDVGRFHFSSMGTFSARLGVVLRVLAGMLLAWAMMANPHFETMVRIQTERNHRVVTTGPYHIVRHPGYIAGIDVMYAKDWIISDNVFVGIQGRTGEGRGAVFLWFDANGCIVERNVIIDCDVGLQLGNAHRADGIEFHCTGCIARNNFITRAPEAGIVTTYTQGCKILHNTIHDPHGRMNRLLRTVFVNEGLVIANNLISGPAISNESDSDIVFVDNCIKDMTELFVDPTQGKLHLKRDGAGKVEKVRVRLDVTDDIDGSPRRPKTPIGADEPPS